ncbi:MAG: trimethylamine methyltransferase family protein, partial [Deltaproteobacteria bacterium]
DIIENVGPGGHFLQESHTLNHFRRELWLPSLMARMPRETWMEAGSQDLDAVIRDRLRNILAHHKVPPLPDKTLEAISAIRKKGEQELAQS